MMKHKGDWLLLLAAFIGGGGFISRNIFWIGDMTRFR